MNKSIKHFTDLDAWKINYQLVIEIYEITKNFPKKEDFGLTSQIRRAVVSIIGNIAEGYARYFYKEKVRFYLISRGSASEVHCYLILSKDLGYLSEKDYDKLKFLSHQGYKLLCGLINSTNRSY